jgi:hypothetical protein
MPQNHLKQYPLIPLGNKLINDGRSLHMMAVSYENEMDIEL